MMDWVLALLLSAAASFVLTPIVRQLAFKLGLVDQPNARKLHQTPMPLMGGLAIYLATVSCIVIFADKTNPAELVAILAGATLVFVVGLLDDRGLLHHQIKLMVAMPIAALVLILSGVHFTLFSSNQSSDTLLVLADDLLSLIWIVGITASFSIFDHMDGLCAGVAGIAAAVFMLFAVLSRQPFVAIIAAAVCGAALGFLRWNFHPAQIFMGDAGAMFLGFMMAVLSLEFRLPHLPQSINWLIAILILAVPVFDTTLVSVSRLRRGLVPFASPGKDHTAHRLANLGLGQRRAVLVLYAVGVCSSLLAALIGVPSEWQAILVAALIVFLALAAILALERVPYERQSKEKRAVAEIISSRV